MVGKKRPLIPPMKGIALDGKVEIVREPTPDELIDQLHALMEQQGGVQPLPRDLYFKQRRSLEWQLTHPTPEQIDWLRWRAVCKALAAGNKRMDDSAYEEAARLLKDTPAAAKPSSMKRSFDKMQRELPEAQQRPRTWRPRQ